MALLIVGIVAPGCYTTIDGGTKIGMPLVRDKLISRYERSPDQVFEASKRVLADMGTLVAEDTINKVVKARVDNNNVWIKVQEIEPGVSEVTTQVRSRTGTPNIPMTAEIDKRIGLQLQAMQ